MLPFQFACNNGVILALNKAMIERGNKMSLTLTVRKVHSTNTDKNLYFCLEKKLIQINGLVCFI